MSISINFKERFRRSFVLVMTITYAAGFLAMLGGFFEALLMAAVLSGITYPLYRWCVQMFGGRDTLASLATLLTTLLVILVPLIFLLGLVAEQAVSIVKEVTPWVEQQLSKPDQDQLELPGWLPFADELQANRDGIVSKLGELAQQVGVYLAGSLARLSEGTAAFFFQLFIMLYSMFFFLKSGPALVDKIMSYAPLSQIEKDRMLEVGLSVSKATIKGTLTIGIIQGVLGGLGFAVVGIDGAVFWGAIMAVLSILPGIGATLVWAPAVAYLLISGQTIEGLGLLIWSAGVVGTIDNVLRPILVGRDTKMPDLLIMLSTLGGLALFGATGLVLGPILAALFLTVLAVYSEVFADWLNPEESRAAPMSDESAGRTTPPS